MAVPARGLRIVVRPGHPDFLDLPWDQSLEEWDVARIVDVVRGLHRHVVRFVDYGGTLYALKELPARLAEREYRLLRRMADEGLPAVEGVAIVTRAGLEAVLVTRYLDYSLPYRTLFTHRRVPDVTGLTGQLLDALAVLLVRLHMAGYYWGDCSLSNTLFRRDAGALAAYLVDVETGEWHPSLTRGQRETDLFLTVDNFAGGLFDVQEELGLPPDDPDPVETAEDLHERYERLWEELNRVEVLGEDASHVIQGRISRLNELGFDVEEVEFVPTDAGDQLVLRAVVVEAGHHQRRLFSLTGLRAQENQARSLLNDLQNFRISIERSTGRPMPESVAAARWLVEVFEPTVAAIPEDLRGKLEPVEVFHEVIRHKYFMSEAAGRDVGVPEAVRSYMASVLPTVPDERTLLVDDEEAFIGYG